MDVLAFTTLFPNPARPFHGLFVARRLAAAAEAGAAVRVVAPVPRPAVHGRLVKGYAVAEEIPERSRWRNLPVWHPRYPMAPGLGLVQPRLIARASAQLLARLIGGRRPALIDAHYLYPDGVAAAHIARAHRLPLVLTARGSDVNHILKQPGYRGQIRKALALARAVVTVSEALRRRLLDLGLAPEKVVTIRNGVDTALFHPRDRRACRRKLDWPQSGPILLAVGNLVAHKRHHLLIPLLADLPDAHLVIIGGGPERRALTERARRAGFARRLILRSPMAPEELALAYGAADLLIHPSAREGIPNVVLEALASGRPVVAAPVGGIPEVVPPPPLSALVDPCDGRMLAQAVKALLAAPPDPQALARHAQGFSWQACAEAVLDVWSHAAEIRP